MAIIIGTIAAVTAISGFVGVGALIGRGGGNQASQVMSAQQNIKNIVKNTIETKVEATATATTQTIQKVFVDIGTLNFVGCPTPEINIIMESSAVAQANALSNGDFQQEVATAVVSKLHSQQSQKTDQTTSAFGSLLAAGNMSNQNTNIKQNIETKVNNAVLHSIQTASHAFTHTDQEITIGSGKDINASNCPTGNYENLRNNLGRKALKSQNIFSNLFGSSNVYNDEHLDDVLHIDHKLIKTQQTSISNAVAETTSKQIIKTLFDTKITAEESNEQLQSAVQSAGDMTGIIILAAIVVGGYFMYKKSKKGKGGDSSYGGESVSTGTGTGTGTGTWLNKKKGMLIALGIISMFVILLILYLIFK